MTEEGLVFHARVEIGVVFKVYFVLFGFVATIRRSTECKDRCTGMNDGGYFYLRLSVKVRQLIPFCRSMEELSLRQAW